MKEETPSFWGIGPWFVSIGFLILLGTIAVSWRHQGFLIVTKSWLILVLFIAGILLLISGVGLWIGAGRRIDGYIKAGVLADRGVYGLARHPLYTGVLLVLAGLAALSRSWPALAVLPVLYLFLSLIVKKEERDMTERFGEAYRDYARRVNAILPRPSAFVSAFLYPGKSGEIVPGILAVKDWDVNFFVLSDGKVKIAIDTGYGGRRCREELRKLGVDPSEITAVLLTHTDVDHRGGLELFNRADLYFGRNEETLVNGECRRHPLFSNRRSDRDYTLLEDGEKLEFGNLSIEAVAAPGHTVGHTAYILNGKYLFSGDSTLIQNGRIMPLYRFFSMNREETVATAEKIRKLAEGKTLITSHSGWDKF